jgi:glutamate racemase
MQLLVFDSGFGGLSVARALDKAMPLVNMTYLADHALFPYGNLSEEALIARVESLLSQALKMSHYDAVVIACNTASTIALKALRAAFTLPIVGTVPAIKPACETTKSKMVSVLATKGTIEREYTHQLIEEFGQGVAVNLVGSLHLARLAEDYLSGKELDLTAVKEELAPCFLGNGDKRTDTIVLGCTHYPLLLPILEKLSPWHVNYIDPAPAIARRVHNILKGLDGEGRRTAITTAPNPQKIYEIFEKQGYIKHVHHPFH